MKMFIVALLFSTLFAFTQSMDEITRQIRYIGNVDIKNGGLSEAEGDFIHSMMVSTYSKGQFEVWTSKNLLDKLNKETVKNRTHDCFDTSCIARAYALHGISGKASKIGTNFYLSFDYILKNGSIKYSKTIVLPTVENPELLRVLMHEIFLFFEQGKEFDESRYLSTTNPPTLSSSTNFKSSAKNSTSRPAPEIDSKKLLKTLGGGLAGVGIFTIGGAVIAHLTLLNPSYQIYLASVTAKDIDNNWRTTENYGAITTASYLAGGAIALIGGGLFLAGVLLPSKNTKSSFWIIPENGKSLQAGFQLSHQF